jgi:uncharacterized protein YbjT (DUF2867 family)
MRVLVLGATGNVGSQLVPRLLAGGHHVRVMTRKPERAAAMGAEVEVKAGDLTSPEGLGAVFADMEGVFLLNGLSMTETHEGLAALEWAKRAAVTKIVYLSVAHVERAPHVPHFGSKFAIEAAIRKSDLDYTILQPNNYFQNDAMVVQAIQQHGVYPLPTGSLGVSRVDVRDIADVAVKAFEGAAPKETIPIGGPEALTGEAIAAAYSRHLHKEVAYVGGDLDAWEKQSIQFLPPWLVFDLRMMFEHFLEHGLRAADEEVARVERLIGHSLRTFDAYAGELVG